MSEENYEYDTLSKVIDTFMLGASITSFLCLVTGFILEVHKDKKTDTTKQEQAPIQEVSPISKERSVTTPTTVKEPSHTTQPTTQNNTHINIPRTIRLSEYTRG